MTECLTSLLTFLAPVSAAFCVSLSCSMGGVSGAFLLVPLQICLLGHSGPGVSATSHLYNLLVCPAGVLRWISSGRMLWPLALILAAGTVPGLVCGVWLRLRCLAGPGAFSLFAAALLVLLAAGLARRSGRGSAPAASARVRTLSFGPRRLVFAFGEDQHTVSVPALLALALAVGVAGGAYGIGGGAVIAPALTTVFRLPVHCLSAATLFATFCTAAAALPLYLLGDPVTGAAARPDWTLGLLFAAGGIPGMRLGARLQSRISQRSLQRTLACLTLAAAAAMLARGLL